MTQPDGPGASTAAIPALAPRPLVASPGFGDDARALVDGDTEAGALRLAQGHDGVEGAIIAFHLLFEVGEPELEVLRVPVGTHQVEDDVGLVCALQEGLVPFFVRVLAAHVLVADRSVPPVLDSEAVASPCPGDDEREDARSEDKGEAGGEGARLLRMLGEEGRLLGPDEVTERPPKRSPDHGDPQEDEEGGDDGGRHLGAHRPLPPRAAQAESPEQPVHDDDDKSDEDAERTLGLGIKRDGHLFVGRRGAGFVSVALKG